MDPSQSDPAPVGPKPTETAALPAGANAQARFGTFGGVFTPCSLTILGVIMFMRSGYVVGEAGLMGALLILAMAKMITTLTTLSLSAIATNTEVRTGGVYYMISRTLGADFGGAIGLTLFVSQAISIAFYVIGFSEALFALFPPGTRDSLSAYYIQQLCSTVVIIGLFGVTFKGADLAIKAQYFILAALLLSVVSFIIGGIVGFDSDNMSANFSGGMGNASFWVVFAIFFPAATGITAGANLSGDLKDPGKSIPNGTLLAIGFTAAVYLVQLILLGGFAPASALAGESFGTLKSMSVFAPLIVVGVWAATLSSALGSFLGAPRILQAMGKDKLLKPLEYFGVGHGPEDEPRRATVLSLGIACAVVWVGSLDAVAEVISMFFLIAYGMINLSAFVEGISGNPSFRPRFKAFGWPAGLVGAIGCAIAMFKINETYAIVSVIIAGGIYFYLRGQAGGDWGDAKRGFIFQRTRANLLLLEKMVADPKNWRPALAIVTDDAERDRPMVCCASWLESERGILSVLEITEVEGATADEKLRARRRRIASVKGVLASHDIVAFADSVVVHSRSQSLSTILQSYSIGSLRPNTVMLTVPPPNQVERRAELGLALRELQPFNFNVILYKGARMERLKHGQIDLWWHGQKNGSLMALFAYLASTTETWKGVRIRMLRIVNSGEEHVEAEESLRGLMEAGRLAFDIEVILSQRPVSELIAERSSSADLVLMGLAARDLGDIESMFAARDPLLAKLPPTLLVLSNGDVDLLA